MKHLFKVTGIAMSLMGGALVSGSAQADDLRHWANADFSHGTFLLSVAGGPVCNGCGVKAGSGIVIWQSTGKSDQIWNDTPPSTGQFPNALPDSAGAGATCLSVAAGSTANGAKLVIWPCSAGTPDQTWQVIPASNFGAPFVNCFVLRNSKSAQVMGVTNGVMASGTAVIQWPLYLGTPNSTEGWHKDQFWCPA